MKKILGILVLFVIYFLTTVNSSAVKSGKIYENEFRFKKLNIDLSPDGEWRHIETYQKNIHGVELITYFLVQLKENKVSRLLEVLSIDNRGVHPTETNQFFYSLLYKANKEKGCVKRLEYYVFKLYKRGMVANCFIVRNWEVNKELYKPFIMRISYTDMNYAPPIIRNYLEKNNIDIPIMMLRSEHYYYSRGKLFWVFRMINPEINGASKTKFNTEETSEYFPSNISKYPDKKKFMDDWVKLAIKRHQIFEEQLKIKPHHKLDLSEYGTIEAIKETKTTISSSSITDQLNKLNNLYKEGAITKEEFEKAKKKTLSQ